MIRPGVKLFETFSRIGLIGELFHSSDAWDEFRYYMDDGKEIYV